MMTEVAPALYLLVALAAWEAVKLAVQRLFKRAIDTDYVTEDQCSNCNAKARAKEDDLRERLGELRGIVLVIAMKVGISEHDIQKLIR